MMTEAICDFVNGFFKLFVYILKICLHFKFFCIFELNTNDTDRNSYILTVSVQKLNVLHKIHEKFLLIYQTIDTIT